MKPRFVFEEIKTYWDSPEAIVVTGMRRTGKTTLLQCIYEQIDSRNKIFLDLENPLNRKYFEEDNYERIKTSFTILGIDFSVKSFIFLDEIQFVKNLPSVVKYFIDHYQVKFFLTGSARYYLKNLFTESLSGRKAIFELFPLSFQEFLIFKEVSIQIPRDTSLITRPIFDFLLPLYEEYMHFGGFPGVVLKANIDEKKKALEDIFTSFFQLEVVQLGDFRKNEVIRDLMLLVMQRLGSRLDIQKISRELGVSRTTLQDYIAFLEGTYFIKIIRPYGLGRNAEIRKMPKVYICDTGMANHFARLDLGALFENSVFQNLRLHGDIGYYRRKTGVEIDFILDREKAYEVKVGPQISDVKKLQGLARGINLRECKVVSKDYCNLEGVIYAFMVGMNP